MFRTSSCSSSGRLVHVVLRNSFSCIRISSLVDGRMGLIMMILGCLKHVEDTIIKVKNFTVKSVHFFASYYIYVSKFTVQKKTTYNLIQCLCQYYSITLGIMLFLYNGLISHIVTNYLYRCTVHFVVHLSNTPTNAHI